MFTSASSETWFAGAFNSLGLDELNSKAAMMERIDNKYVISGSVLHGSLSGLRDAFDVLEIKEKRAFTYATRYFDGPHHESYLFHHQGRRRRCKVRIRTYIDTGLCYLEVKLKDKRGVTVKKRKGCPLQSYDLMPHDLNDFVNSCHDELYGSPLPYPLSPALDITYRRMTLVAREGGERMTIDGGLEFSRLGRHERIDDGLFIVETKSSNGNGLADKIFRQHHQHPTNRCSKYCTGLAMTEGAIRTNAFRSTMVKLGWRPQ